MVVRHSATDRHIEVLAECVQDVWGTMGVGGHAVADPDIFIQAEGPPDSRRIIDLEGH
jgi:hypothetical protein